MQNKSSALLLFGFLVAFHQMACATDGPVNQPTNTTNSPATARDSGPVSNPANDPNFLILTDGFDLRKIIVLDLPLSLTYGTGTEFTDIQQSLYKKLKRQTQTDPKSKVQWALMDLDHHQVLQKSLGSDRKMFGASSSKVFVAGALLDAQQGHLSAEQLQLMGNMLAVSSNVAWLALQNQIGGGDDDRGREAIYAFTQKLGYQKTRAFQGSIAEDTPNEVHGNELTADETVRFLHDTYWGQFQGASTLWKFMHTCRTGTDRALRYLPKEQIIGGKTGTYRGESVDPETGLKLNPDGSKYLVNVRNQQIVFNLRNRQFALVVLADSGSDDSAALLAGGLYREYSK
jgi:hypothetical protein